MVKIRKGNDFLITWQVIINGGETTLEQLEDVTIELVDSNGKACPIEYEIKGDSVHIRFRGKDQDRIGAYKLILWVSRGQSGQAVIDHCDAFYLTSCSDKASINEQSNPNINPEVIIDSVNLAVGIKGDDGITPHIDPETGNWFLGNVDTGVHAQGEPGEDGLGDAPINGRHYGRRDGAWAELDTIFNSKQNIISDLGIIRNGAAAGREALATAFQYIIKHPVPVPVGKDVIYYMSDVWRDSLDKTILHVQYDYDEIDGFNSVDLVYPTGTARGSKLVVSKISKDAANPRKLVVNFERMPSYEMTGDLSMLLTTNKSNLVAAINEVNGKKPQYATDEEIDELFDPDYEYIDPDEGFIPVEPDDIITG